MSPATAAAAGSLSQRAHRRLVGVLGLCLPAFCYLGAGALPTRGLVRWSLLPSLSAYYYTFTVGIFVGILIALALFLLTYPGYQGERADRVLGGVAGLAAMGVAIFPTAAPAGTCEPSWWSSPLRTVHYVSAVVLFLSFILFATWLFRKSSAPRRQDRTADKRRRDAIYLTCGSLMMLGVLWAASSLVTGAPIFWPEALAIEAFAVSWLVKGEADEPLKRAVSWLASRGSRSSGS